MRPFLLTLLQLQAFEQFIGDRLAMLNSGRGFKGRFETEANNYVDRMDAQNRYREWIKVVICHLFAVFCLRFFLLLIFCAFYCYLINSNMCDFTDKRKAVKTREQGNVE